MKTVLVVDGADNCAYDHFEASDQLFAALFPGEGQDIEFIEDFWDRRPSKSVREDFKRLWENPISKSEVAGIHGVLFFGLLHKKAYYPNKRDSDLDGTGRPWRTGAISKLS
ncbi:MAG: hypothetical protein DI533_00205 [Cereibacter sphaeroides]|uniref:Uncharacterized protein n=1 Tax=Cereibacter sphaeroides TaxID=1063 RepID=A0A2W5S873_CERSP|nr:MAG: hypothetical protein DI533_00205 [Cereibacter sphaeroides]